MTENLPALQQRATDLKNYLQRPLIKEQLQAALPRWLSPDRLLRIVFTAVMKNPKLLDCSIESLLQSIMQCAQLGLEPILGRAYLIPYENSKKIGDKWEKVLECQFQPGYQGLVDLARRSGEVKDVFAKVVYENDRFELEYGTERKLRHTPCLTGEPGGPIGAYTVWELKDGTKTFEFMPIHEINKRRDQSQAYRYAANNPNNKNAQDCPWIKWWDEQAMKTVVKHHSKLQPSSIEFMEAVEMDDAVDVGRRAAGMFSDNILIHDPAGQIEHTGGSLAEGINRFDELVAQKIMPNDEHLLKFLDATAAANGVTVDALKDQASRRFASFWTSFVSWLKRNGIAPPDDEKPPGGNGGKPDNKENGSAPAGEDPPPSEPATDEAPIVPGASSPPDENPWNTRENWLNFKSGKDGLSTWAYKNQRAFADAKSEIRAEVIEKWRRTYPDYDLPGFMLPSGLADSNAQKAEVIETIKSTYTPEVIAEAKKKLGFTLDWPPSLEGANRLLDMCMVVSEGGQ